MASNPIPQNPPASAITADRASQIIGTVTAVAAEIEKLIAGSGVGGSAMPQIEQLTGLFGNLAGVAIQAAHDVMGKAVSPESVLALIPVATPLVDPPPVATSGA